MGAAVGAALSAVDAFFDATSRLVAVDNFLWQWTTIDHGTGRGTIEDLEGNVWVRRQWLVVAGGGVCVLVLRL